jgi:hypothetical protein
MTADQFDALATLIRLQASASREAARLVLVDGATVTTAAVRTGLTRQGASQVVLRCREAIELARVVVG